MSLPLVVKAPTQGSTIGTTFVHERKDVVRALETAYRYDRVALVEQFIGGIEVTAPVLGNDDPVTLPLIEIVSATGVYDYEAKYTPGMSDHIIPPRIPGEQQAMIKELAVRTFKALGCRGLARVDFMVEPGGGVYILEVNTIPGMTATSLFPDSARAAGIDFPQLVDQIVKLAPGKMNYWSKIAYLSKTGLARLIDHTLLEPEATPADIAEHCRQAREYEFASVCVHPCYVPVAYDLLSGSPVAVCAVVGVSPLEPTLPR